MSIILDTRTQSSMKSVQYNGRRDPGGYIKIEYGAQALLSDHVSFM